MISSLTGAGSAQAIGNSVWLRSFSHVRLTRAGRSG
jgi:hypothetical protein